MWLLRPSPLKKPLKLMTLTTFGRILHPKTSHCPINFSLIFMFFHNPSWRALLAPKAPIYAPKWRRWDPPPLIFRGPKINLWSAIFAKRASKKLPGEMIRSVLGRFGANLGATWRRKRPRSNFYQFLSHFDRFVCDCGWLLTDFG